MFSKFFSFLRDNFFLVIWISVMGSLAFYAVFTHETRKVPVAKEVTDGIRNHLVWTVKGECFFVMPITNTDLTSLIRVEDCDKK